MSKRIELPPAAIGYVYRTDCAEQGWSYIGQSRRLDRQNLDGYFGSGASIKAAIAEVGVAGLEKRLIAAADDQITLHYLEMVAIAEARKDGVTLLNGDFGGPTSVPRHAARSLGGATRRDGAALAGDHERFHSVVTHDRDMVEQAILDAMSATTGVMIKTCGWPPVG